VLVCDEGGEDLQDFVFDGARKTAEGSGWELLQGPPERRPAGTFDGDECVAYLWPAVRRAAHPEMVGLFTVRVVGKGVGGVVCGHCDGVWPCARALELHSCEESPVCRQRLDGVCAFRAEWVGNQPDLALKPDRLSIMAWWG
jgi:hypothetical protein